MNPKTEILAAVTKLSRAKNANVAESVLETYVDLLTDLPFGDVVKACRELAMTKTFGFPQVGEIREVATRDTIGTVHGRALMAWARVLKACRMDGAYRDVAFADPVMGEALLTAVGSWPRMCTLCTDSYEFSKVRETFLSEYERLALVPVGGEPFVLNGIHTGQRPPAVVGRIDGLDAKALPAHGKPRPNGELPPMGRSEASALLKLVMSRAQKVTTP